MEMIESEQRRSKEGKFNATSSTSGDLDRDRVSVRASDRRGGGRRPRARRSQETRERERERERPGPIELPTYAQAYNNGIDAGARSCDNISWAQCRMTSFRTSIAIPILRKRDFGR
jgi:hypothetical protein